ncbi:MAG: hypothetical protein BRC22_00120 [Parcubacteria group bacterium QH_9_35_7]|nr:MAG: hypothetical protein BRC22_00120 [Parcubacteria group bacterium QH_9_35_7]
MKRLLSKIQKKSKNFYWFLIFLFTFYPKVLKAQDSIIIDCATKDPTKGGYCNNINHLLKQGIRIGEYLLGIAGSLALLAFIYGGIMMMVSFGNQERFRKGRKALVAASVGLLIAFSAYIIIGFVLEALGVRSNLRSI